MMKTKSPERRSPGQPAGLGRLSRRAFLVGAAGAAAAFALNPIKQRRAVPCRLLGAARPAGHLLRAGALPQAPRAGHERVVIVGGGISGLSAAHELSKHGMHDYLLVELESQVGGTSQSGRNAISEYPWAAHYLPLPGDDAVLVRELLAEAGVIKRFDAAGRPEYDEYALCHAPEERLLIHGRWQSGFVPEDALPASDRMQVERFFRLMRQFEEARGADGRFAFSIPKAASSQDPVYRMLDRISMADYLWSRGFTSKYLRWYVDYCCRDDYGGRAARVSAWAGVHYFASRRFDAANVSKPTVLTWPEGNGFLVKVLRRGVSGKVRTGALAYRVEGRGPEGAAVHLFEPAKGNIERIDCERVVYAAPRFTAARVVEQCPACPVQYGPWVVANISLRARDPRDAPDNFAWDNVFYGGRSLGYVVSTHQNLHSDTGETVLTWYCPLDDLDPASSRKHAETFSAEDWGRLIQADFARFQPEVLPRFAQIDVWVWGHAMALPSPGMVWGANLPMRLGNVLFAHSDMSGFSIFEEAQYHGVQAARSVLNELV